MPVPISPEITPSRLDGKSHTFFIAGMFRVIISGQRRFRVRLLQTDSDTRYSAVHRCVQCTAAARESVETVIIIFCNQLIFTISGFMFACVSDRIGDALV